MYTEWGVDRRLALVNGAVGIVTFREGRPFSIAGVTVRGGKVVELDFVAAPERVGGFELSSL